MNTRPDAQFPFSVTFKIGDDSASATALLVGVPWVP